MFAFTNTLLLSTLNSYKCNLGSKLYILLYGLSYSTSECLDTHPKKLENGTATCMCTISKHSRPRCYTKSPSVSDHLCWDDWEMGAVIPMHACHNSMQLSWNQAADSHVGNLQWGWLLVLTIQMQMRSSWQSMSLSQPLRLLLCRLSLSQNISFQSYSSLQIPILDLHICLAGLTVPYDGYPSVHCAWTV